MDFGLGKLLVAFTFGALVAGTAQSWRYGEKIASAESAIDSERTEAMRFVLAEQEISDNKMVAADTTHSVEVAKNETKITELDRGLANGTRGLRVATKCPSTISLPKTNTLTSVGGPDIQGSELADFARPDYLALLRGIDKLEAALKVCVEGR